MKTVLCIVFIVLSVSGFSQVKKYTGKIKRNKSTQHNTKPSTDPLIVDTARNMQPRETATDRYLKGPQRRSSGVSATDTASTGGSPFAGGIHASDNAAKTFDTAGVNRANTNISTTTNTNTTAAAGNDTIFNVNTINQGGITTNSGAVDRSGQSQFGQTNWGNTRSTVGESQWTIPPPITASFNKEFPASNSATWTRNNADTNIYSAKYKSDAQWVIANYNASGQRLDTRTEFSLAQPPRPVSVFMAKQPAGFQALTIYKLQVQGKSDVYEIKSSAGKTVYVNNDGVEVNY